MTAGLGRVLLVEDERDLREMVVTRLRGSGYEVAEADTVHSALELTRQFLPDIVLLDVGLPDGSGFDLLETLRSEPGAPAIIFLTALGTPDNRLRGLYGGAVDFLAKPFDLGELVARIAAAMRQRRQLDQVVAAAETDPLTGLRNRRACETALADELHRARRQKRVFALAYIDADKLKVVNDRYGHAAGDDYLRTIARTIEATCRTNELAARVGGDEFAVILQETDRAGAGTFLDRLRRRFQGVVITVPDGEHPVSVSAGCAVFPDDGTDAVALLAAADRAMYAAKQH